MKVLKLPSSHRPPEVFDGSGLAGPALTHQESGSTRSHGEGQQFLGGGAGGQADKGGIRVSGGA